MMYNAWTGAGRSEGCVVVRAAGEVWDVGEVGGVGVGHVWDALIGCFDSGGQARLWLRWRFYQAVILRLWTAWIEDS